MLVVEAFLGLEYETTLEFVLLLLVCSLLVLFVFGLGLLPFKDFVRADVVALVEFMQQNVLVSLCACPAQRSSPGVAGKSRELLAERKHLDPEGNGSDEVSIGFAMREILHEAVSGFRPGVQCLLVVDFQSGLPQYEIAHFTEAPGLAF